MSMTLISLIAAGLFFLGIHIGISGTALRQRFVGILGEGPYAGLFSLASLGGIVWFSMSYNAATAETYAQTWGQLYSMKVPAAVLIFFGFMLAVPGILSPNPGAVGADKLLDSDEPATGMLRITRHPFLWGVFLWAIAHLLVNGDAPSLIFFGTFALIVLMGTVSLDAKKRQALGERWERFEAVTSSIPFAAIYAGRNSLKLAEVGWWRWLAGLVAFVGFVYFHGWLFSVSAL